MKNINSLKDPVLKTILHFIIASIIIASCSPQEGGTKTENDGLKVEPVKVDILEKQKIPRIIELASTLMAFDEVHYAPATPGRIEKILVEVGSRVKRGDVLVQMDRTQLHQAKLQYANIETDFRRSDTLYQAGSLSQQRYDQVKMQYEVAKANLEFLQENTVLMAPFDGVISGKYFQAGELYSGAPNTAAGKAAIVSLVQLNPLKALVNISETYFPQLKQGKKVEVVCDIYPDKTFFGELFRMYPVVDPASRTFTVEVKINNPGEILRPGMFCRVNLNLGDAEALVVPSVAVLKLQGSNERYIFIEEDGLAKRMVVQPGNRFDDNIEIVSDGLKEGMRIIISGQARLLDDTRVKVVD